MRHIWIENEKEKGNLTGRIPSEIGLLTTLEKLHLGNNQLEGTIPTEIKNLKSLEAIDLHDNALNGTLPPEIWKLPKLESLKLYGNVISGDISGLASSTSLRHIWIENEKEKGNLTGSIPSEIGLLTNLEKLYLGNNQLEGTIPTEIKNLKSLEAFSVFDNNISGPFPNEFMNRNKLQRLFLEKNKLTGGIHSSFGLQLQNLTDFRAYSNNLTGTIPTSLQAMNQLKVLYLDNNEFTGELIRALDWSNLGECCWYILVHSLSNVIFSVTEFSFCCVYHIYLQISLQYILICPTIISLVHYHMSCSRHQSSNQLT